MKNAWKQASYGNCRFKSRSALVQFYLKRYTTMSQTNVAKKCKVSIPRVNQVLWTMFDKSLKQYHLA
jgi:hypothetical protein